MSRILCLDYGERRVGVAISDETRTLASGRGVLPRAGILDSLGRLVEENAVAEIVLGLPINMDGTASRMAQRVQEFGRALEARCGVPVRYWDERLTTVTAEAALRELSVRRPRQRELVDEMSAILILQSYLDSRPPSTDAT